MAYVYKHIRMDKNEVFYIGIGTDKYFFRPKDKKRRNNHWKNITSISEWIYEIVFMDDDLKLVKEKEKDLIKLYGRSIDGGTLCNMTMGGEGTIGLTPKNIRKCYGLSPEKIVYEFKSISDAAKFIGYPNLTGNIVKICNKNGTFCKKWRFSYDESGLFTPVTNMTGKIKNSPSKLSQKIWGKSPNGEILEFENAYRAAEFIDSHHTLVRKVCKGKTTHTKFWKFSYSPM